MEALALRSPLLVLSGLLIFLALYLPEYLNPSAQSFTVGDVAPGRYRGSLSGLSYESEVLTDDRREAAASVVPQVFASPDPSVAREEVEKLRSTMNYGTSDDEGSAFASNDQKATDLAALRDIQLTQETAARILD